MPQVSSAPPSKNSFPESTAEHAAIVPLEAISVRAFTVPTDAPESDGTLEWRSTTLVLVELGAAGERGLGFTYADTATARVIHEHLIPELLGKDAWSIEACWERQWSIVRNIGAAGVCAMAISAVDCALWDLKARMLKMPLITLLGAARRTIPVYGSGGFTSYTLAKLREQLSGWVDAGLPAVKMKIGRDPEADSERVRSAREAIGDTAGLFVDANGAHSRQSARLHAETFGAFGVSWFEEPVSSDDLDGLCWLRTVCPAGMDITAGEYGYDARYFRRMCAAGAVDVLQADATRCGGVTGFLRAAAIADAFQLPLSSHCAPSIHVHVGCAAPRMRHLEYFHDHVRIEQMFFDGALIPVNGCMTPDLTRPGIGLELKESDAARYAV
jgi:L-alanine-DL-glutamate epimerase-like enolase superfamily enzyme